MDKYKIISTLFTTEKNKLYLLEKDNKEYVGKFTDASYDFSTREISIHLELQKNNDYNKYITPLVEYFIDHDDIVTIYEKGECDLFEKIISSNIQSITDENIEEYKQEFKERLNLFLYILESIQFLHKNNIVHLDIKIENIVLFKNTPKLIDFEYSQRLFNDEAITDVFVGTKKCCDPVVKNKYKQTGVCIYTKHNDIYALGVLLYELISSKTFKSSSTNNEFILSKISEKYVPTCILDILKKMLIYDIDKRLTLEELATCIKNLNKI